MISYFTRHTQICKMFSRPAHINKHCCVECICIAGVALMIKKRFCSVSSTSAEYSEMTCLKTMQVNKGKCSCEGVMGMPHA